MLFGRKNLRVGLDIGSSSVKAIELSRSKRGYEIVGFARHSLGPEMIVDGAVSDAAGVSEAVKLAFMTGGFKASHTVTGVSGHSVIVKRVVVPVDSPEEVAGYIEFGADEFIPFDISEVNLDYEIIGPASGDDGGGVEILLVAAKKDQIENHTNVVSMAGHSAEIVDIDAFALQNAFEINYNPNPSETIALLNIGASLTNISIAKGGVPLFVRDVSVGGNQYTDILQKELQISYAEAEDLKFGKQVGMYDAEMVAPLFDSVTDLLTMEVRKTFEFFKETDPDETISRVYLAGGVSKAEGLAEKIGAGLGVPTEIMDPFKNVTIGPKVRSSLRIAGAEVAVALGLALRGVD